MTALNTGAGPWLWVAFARIPGAEVRAVAPQPARRTAFSACSHSFWEPGEHGGVSSGAAEDTDLELSRGEKGRERVNTAQVFEA